MPVAQTQQQVPPGFQWIVGLLLSVIAFFLVSTYMKIDTVDNNVQKLMINDGSNQEWKKAMERRMQSVENHPVVSELKSGSIN